MDSIYQDKDLTALEKKAGKKAARTIQRNWKNILRKSILATASVKQGKGIMLASASAKPRMRFSALDSITVTASPATFKQHYGFEGIKENGRRMSMKPFNHFDHLFDKSDRALKKLVAEIAEIRGEAITTKLQEIIKLEKPQI